MCGGPQSCVRSPSIIVVSTCCPASRHSPKNAVRVSARMWSNGSGNCAVASAAHARASPPEDPVRLFFIGGSFRYGCGDHRPSIGRRKEPPLFFSTDQFNSRWDIPSAGVAELRGRAGVTVAIAVSGAAFLVWNADLSPWPSVLLLAIVVSSSVYFLWLRYLMTFYEGGSRAPNSTATADDRGSRFT